MLAPSVLLAIIAAASFVRAYEYGDLERPGEFITLHDEPPFSSQLVPNEDGDPLNENESIGENLERYLENFDNSTKLLSTKLVSR